MNEYTASNGTEEAILWADMSGCNPTPVLIRNCQFIGQPTTRHIVTAEKLVTIQDVTLFPGRLTPWGAIRWGVLTLLRLGEKRIGRIKGALMLWPRGQE